MLKFAKKNNDAREVLVRIQAMTTMITNDEARWLADSLEELGVLVERSNIMVEMVKPIDPADPYDLKDEIELTPEEAMAELKLILR